jgi:hypothetical protein
MANWKNEQTAIVWHWLNSSPTRRSFVVPHVNRGDAGALKWFVRQK